MKKALSLFLTLVLALSMSITAFSARITDAVAGFSDLNWHNEGGGIVYGTGSNIDLGDVEPGHSVFAGIPGDGSAFTPPSDAYEAEMASPSTTQWTGYTKKEIQDSKLTMRLQISKGSSAIDQYGIIYDGISGEALIGMWFVDPFPQSGSDDIDFEFRVAPLLSNKTTVGSEARLYGTLKNDGSYVAPPPKSDSSSSSSSSNSNRDTTPSTPAPSSVNQTTAVRDVRDAVNAAKNSPNGATVKLQNVTTVSLSTLKEMSKAAGNTDLNVNADSLNDDGSVDVRITIDPSKATGGINLSASTNSIEAKTAEMKFAKHFNNTVSAVSLSQKGNFGMPVKVAAKIDPKLNKDTLVFYSYDSATNSFKKIDNPQYKVDKNGYVHFTTSVGGEIIISDKPLTKKK